MPDLRAETIDIGWPDPGNVPGLFATSMAATVRDMEYHGCMGKIHRVQSSVLTWSRNAIVKSFLEGDAPWLWMVDSDMVFDKGHPMKLWEAANEYDAKMVSGLAFIFKDNEMPVPSIFYPSPEDPDLIGLAANMVPSEPSKVMATGLASSLVHRDVFEAMEAPRDDKYRWFDIIHLGNHQQMAGEDVQFFMRARELGYDLIIEPAAETWHIKSIGLGRKDWERYWELRGFEETDNEGVRFVYPDS